MDFRADMTLASDHVCVLLPVFNGALYLEEQLRSLLEQTLPSWNCLIWDDGSRDGSDAIIAKHCSRYPERFTQINNTGGNVGVIGALNRLSPHVRSAYFALCDQDDVWKPEKLTACLAALKSLQVSNDIPLLAVCDQLVVDAALKPTNPSFWRLTKSFYHVEDINCLPVFNSFPGCTMLGNKALLDAAFPIPSSAIMHDYWIALLAKYGGCLTAVDVPLMLYRQHAKNQCGVAPTRSLFRRLLSRLSNVAGYLDQVRRLREGRLSMLTALAARVVISHQMRAAYDEAIAAERGNFTRRLRFLRRNRISPTHAFVYWLG